MKEYAAHCYVLRTDLLKFAVVSFYNLQKLYYFIWNSHEKPFLIISQTK